MSFNSFSGRNGVDTFSIFLLLVAALIVGIPPYLWIASLVLIALVIWRGLSRNLLAREREQRVFTRIMNTVGYACFQFGKGVYRVFKPLVLGIAAFIRHTRERRANVIIRCPSCHAKLRLPRGRGKLAVTCPVCHTTFFHRT